MCVVIVADSLDLPQESERISLKDTWTEKILKSFAGSGDVLVKSTC